MDKKFAPLAILEILKEDSDETNVLTTEYLIKKLKNKYRIDIERRTIYSNINLLIDIGYDISSYSDNNKGYYLISREFEPYEITLLCNAVHSSRFIPSKYSKDLINKLLNTQGKSFKNKYNYEVYLPNFNKKDNKDFFLNIDIITDAIINKKVISYFYTKYDYSKKQVKRDNVRRTLSPHHIVYTNDKVYLIGYSDKHQGIIHIRVDRMIDIKIEENEVFIKEKNKKDPYDYAKTKIYMYAGEDIDITIRCKDSILDDVIESFGTGISVVSDGDGYFKAYVKSSKQGIIYLALQFLENMEVISPKDIRKEIKEILDSGLKRYK